MRHVFVWAQIGKHIYITEDSSQATGIAELNKQIFVHLIDQKTMESVMHRD